MRQKVVSLSVAFGLIATLAVAGIAEEKNPGDKKGKEKEVPLQEKVKDFDKFEGLFTIYQNPKDGATFLKVDEDQLGKEFIYFSHIQDGLVGTRHFRGRYRGSKIFTIRKHFNRLEFVAENTSYYFDENAAISRAKDANISHAVLSNQKIESEAKDGSAFLVKADALFLDEDVAPVKPVYPKDFKGYKLGKLSKDKSKYLHIKSYPKNTDLVVEFVYEDASPEKSAGAGATDSRFVSTRVQHSLIEVPANDFQPRPDDPRIGYFTREVTDLTSMSATPYRDLIHRWHLKKKNPDDEISEPMEPITWWIENTTPRHIRSIVKEGVLAWNRSFAKIGFKNAVQVKIQPDDAEWDAGDLRYNVLRWTSSPQPPFGGYGPSFVNPRSGQILGADIMLEYSFMARRLNFEGVFSTAALEHPFAELFREDEHCMLGNHLQMSNLFGLTANRVLNADQVRESELLTEATYYLMLHEVGHTLGLNHNMKASQMLTPERINDAAFTRENGLTGSVMDYPAINIVGDKQRQGQYYTTVPGPYDDWVIEYGYSPADPDPEKEARRLSKIASRSTEPALVFGNDADDMRSPGKAIDPRINTGDMTSDAITFAVDRIKLAKKVATELKEKFRKNDQSYHELRNAYFIMTGQHATSLRVISRYIGGVYLDRAFQGQDGATKPFQPVATADQKRAMVALQQYAFAPDAFALPNDLYNYLQQQRRGFNHRREPEDPKIHDRVLNIQKGILDHLLHKNVMQRITDSNLYGNDYSLADAINDLSQGIFHDDLNGPVNDFRKNLQAEYVKRLVEIMGKDGKSDYDHVSQGLAYYHLKEIGKMLAGATSSDSGTGAHRTYLADLIRSRIESM